MNTNFFLILIKIAVLFSFTSCTKSDDVNRNSQTIILPNGEIEYGSNIEGAMQLFNIKTSGFTIFPTTTQMGKAWFGKFPNYSNVGPVTCNDSILNLRTTFNWYFYLGDNLFNLNDNYFNWSIQGNAASGINSFVYRDTVNWPTSFNFISSSSVINQNQSFTISWDSLPRKVSGFIFTLSGKTDEDSKSFGVMTNLPTSNLLSMTFSSNDLKLVAKNTNVIGVSASPIFIGTAGINNKTYNFIKQYQITKYYPVQ